MASDKVIFKSVHRIVFVCRIARIKLLNSKQFLEYMLLDFNKGCLSLQWPIVCALSTRGFLFTQTKYTCLNTNISRLKQTTFRGSKMYLYTSKVSKMLTFILERPERQLWSARLAKHLITAGLARPRLGARWGRMLMQEYNHVRAHFSRVSWCVESGAAVIVRRFNVNRQNNSSPQWSPPTRHRYSKVIL